MKKLNKVLAAGLAAVCLLGTVTPVSASSTTITSLFGQGLKSKTINPDADVHMYGSASCVKGSFVTGDIAQCSARMTGSLAAAYTNGACSFGYNSSITNIRDVTYFVASGKFSYSDDAPMFHSYTGANTVLYY